MKQAIIHVDCCRECPFMEKGLHGQYAPGYGWCGDLEKQVELIEIDHKCELEDE